MIKKIKKFEEKTLKFEGLPDYLFQVSLVPPSLCISTQLWTEFDDRSIDVPCDLGSVWIRVVLSTDPGQFVAHAIFGIGTTSAICDSIEVLEEHRRNRIATTAYNFVGSITGGVVEPSLNQTLDAEAFWEQRRKQKYSTPTAHIIVHK